MMSPQFSNIRHGVAGGEIFNTAGMEDLRMYIETNQNRVTVAGVIMAQAPSILQEKAIDNATSSPSFAPHVSKVKHTHHHNLHNFLNGCIVAISAAISAGDPVVLDELIVPSLENYNSLGIPVDVTKRAIQALQEATIHYVAEDHYVAEEEIVKYFAHLRQYFDNPTQELEDRESLGQSQLSEKKTIVDRLQSLVDQLTPKEKIFFTKQLEKILAPSSPNSDSQDAFTASLIGRQLSQEERLELEFASLKQSFDYRRKLLERPLTASQVAELLGTSRQTPHDRVRNGSLLAVLDNGVWRFPIWQFDPQGPDGVIAGLPEVLRSLEVPPFSKLSWMVSPNPFLDGLTPVEALKKGQKDQVVYAASAIGVK